jgi:hypothetical protein
MRREIQTVSRTHRSADSHRSHRQPFRHAAAPAFGRVGGARASRHARPVADPDPITLGAATWLACGIVLLVLTPLPLRNVDLGWSFTFWALAAPSLVLLARRIRRAMP